MWKTLLGFRDVFTYAPAPKVLDTKQGGGLSLFRLLGSNQLFQGIFHLYLENWANSANKSSEMLWENTDASNKILALRTVARRSPLN